MRKFIPVLALVLLGSAYCEDQMKAPLKSPVRGYLVDMLCVRQRKSEGVKLGQEHTRMCLRMPNCIKSGYAVMTPDYQILKFDQKGTAKAIKLLAKTDQQQGFIVQVSGTITGDEIQVSKIEVLKPDAIGK